MSTVIGQSDLVRRAAAFVADTRKTHPERSLHAILDEAGMRFNLTPLDSNHLLRLFTPSDDAAAGRGLSG